MTHNNNSTCNNNSRSNSTNLVGLMICDYRIEKLLGEGNYAKVFLAQDTRTASEKVALKLLSCPPHKKVSDWRERVEKEIEIMEMLRGHKNILGLIEIIDISESDVCLVLEYVKGGDLLSLITDPKRGKLTEKQAVKVMRQLVAAVDYCHSQGITHRDIKPENILIDRSTMTIKLADFGLSAFMWQEGNHRLFHECCGSPQYSAPEILRGSHYDGAAVDVWAMGVTLYTIVTGYFPWEGKNDAEQLQNAAMGRYHVPSYLSDDCAHAIASMLTVNPTHRTTVIKLLETPWINPNPRKCTLRPANSAC